MSGFAPPPPVVPEIDVDQLDAARGGGAPVIDVRQPDEFEDVHATGAILIPLGDVPDRIDEIPRDQTVYVICRSGARSRRAAEYLVSQGYDAVNVAGGTLAWVEAELPVEHGG